MKSMVYTSRKGKEKKSFGSSNLIESEDEELVEEELQAYIDQGAMAKGEFPINNDVTLRQDMLSKHLNQLLVGVYFYKKIVQWISIAFKKLYAFKNRMYVNILCLGSPYVI